MPGPDTAKSRLAYIDWMRGLACLLMFQTHCYDSWLSPQARQSRFFMYSQLGGTFPAPLFLFLAGISFALVTEKLWQKDVPTGQIARTTILRGGEIFVYGLLFRLQEYVVAWGWAPKSDLLRVDVLNTIGVSMMLMGVVCWLVLALRSGPQPTTTHRFAGKPDSGRRRNGLADFAADPSSLDQLATDLAALADRVLRRWRAQHGLSAAGILPHLSMDGIRVRGTGRGIPAAKPVGADAGTESIFLRSGWRAAC